MCIRDSQRHQWYGHRHGWLHGRTERCRSAKRHRRHRGADVDDQPGGGAAMTMHARVMVVIGVLTLAGASPALAQRSVTDVLSFLLTNQSIVTSDAAPVSYTHLRAHE